MRFRLKAFGLHLLGSACTLSLILGALYVGWYRWPGWYLTGVLRVVAIVMIVDLALGPTLTLIVANPDKPRRALARDIAVIVVAQLAALVYGAVTLWLGRPLYYAFSADRLEIVQASDLNAGEIIRAQRDNPALAPHWYSLPRWVWAPLPEDPQEAAKIVNSTLFGGQDVVNMPRYFKPWSEGLAQLRQQLAAVDDIKNLSEQEKQSAAARMRALGLSPQQRNALPLMWGDVRRLITVFDPDTLTVRAILRPD
jgi:hypothetical protein